MITTLLKYFLEDLPVLITTFISLYCVFKIFLKKPDSKPLKSLIIYELFEHLVVPWVLFLILIFTNSTITAIAFHTVLLAFIFGYLGKRVYKAQGKEWMDIFHIAFFIYFFVFAYPRLVIWLQMVTPITGWYILGATNLAFIGTFIYSRIKGKKSFVLEPGEPQIDSI